MRLPLATIGSMPYNHTQYGRWLYILFALTLATLAGIWLARSDATVVVMLWAIAAIYSFCGLVFGSLTTWDKGDYLALRFGPLPLLRKRIRYADITGIEVSRSKVIDGWGVHYMPGRGWTYNIWGFDCVKLTLGRKIIRVGTDDAEGLATLLCEKTGISSYVE